MLDMYISWAISIPYSLEWVGTQRNLGPRYLKKSGPYQFRNITPPYIDFVKPKPEAGTMSTVVSLPEKRHDLGQDLFPEPPPEKRAKLTAMESKSAEEAKAGEGSSAHTLRATKFVCEICFTNGHTCWDCPKRSQGMGLGCVYCYGPCKKKDDDPREHKSMEMVKHCVVCGKMGKHWAYECPYRSDGDDDDDFGDEFGF
ncbi:hypothetical protein ACS0TY_025345 [Phlomoides rotata]